jgi:hypothetical protein
LTVKKRCKKWRYPTLLPGRNYKDFVALEFFVVITAAAFTWSILFLFLDMARALCSTIQLNHSLKAPGDPTREPIK